MVNSAPRTGLAFATDVARALDAREFLVYYQPIVRLANAETVGVEALVRWNDPARGLILPGEFLPAAQSGGLLGRIGDWVLAEACREAARWSGTELGVAVNVSVTQLTRRELTASHVAAALNTAALPGAALTLEISEAAGLGDLADLHTALQPIRALGVRIALDDFGVAESSLQRLAGLQADIVKLDAYFVADLDDEDRGTRARSITTAVLDLAATMNFIVIAEGIERPTQADTLRQLGCIYGQGFLYAHSMQAENLARLLDLTDPPSQRHAG